MGLALKLALGLFRRHVTATGGGGGPAVGDGLLLEDGVSSLLLESGDFLLLE